MERALQERRRAALFEVREEGMRREREWAWERREKSLGGINEEI